MERRRIAIVGKMGSGKTTLAQTLSQMGFVKIAFADPVKDVSAAMLNMFVREVYGSWSRPPHDVPAYFDRDIMNEVKGNPIMRRMLQFVGTELGRQYFGPEDVWIRKFLDSVEDAEEAGAIGVINDDCRFVNEAERLKTEGFFIVKLVRDEAARRAYLRDMIKQNNADFSDDEVTYALTDILDHASEAEIDKIEADVDIPTIETDLVGSVEPYIMQRYPALGAYLYGRVG